MLTEQLNWRKTETLTQTRQHADRTIKLEENRNAYTNKAIIDFKQSPKS